jgi:uncharacterized protein (DUF2164 family)
VPQTRDGRGSIALPACASAAQCSPSCSAAAQRATAAPAGRNAAGHAPALRITITRGNPMAIELDKDVRDRAIASLQRYFTENMDEPIGNIQAGALLHFFVEEIAPAIYNLAIADAQERLHARVAELDIECHAEPFEYWKKQPGRKR